jgi:hypothetical protein
MLKTARRSTEIESIAQTSGYVIHVESLEANALAKSRCTADMQLFEGRERIGVLLGLLPAAADSIV